MKERKLIYIPLSIEEQEAIVKLAKAEKREPREQVAYLIRQKLIELKLLKPKENEDV